MALGLFHPAVSAWLSRTFRAPTAPQALGWPAIRDGRHTLIAAPTGSGKTLAAFLSAIDSLVRQGLDGTLPDETQVVYVSPLKALSNDIQRNLMVPLAGIREALAQQGLPPVDIRVLVRTGDTPQSERAAMRRKPPHVLVTTPESLYLLLTSGSGRAMLAAARTVIVDEIHAVAGTKRGSHLSLSLERLAALAARPLQRIGLSATQRPIEEVARFLVGGAGPDGDGGPACTIVDTGHIRERDLALELPRAPLETVMSNEVWNEVYDRLAQLVREHRTTLIFVNTRRLAERVTRHLSERLGKTEVAAHHGSLSKEQRLDAERRLKEGRLRALVATASLELGIDIGDVDLVCQLGSPRSIATFVQRVGRANHSVSGVPAGRLFPLSRDDLIECAALLDAVRRGELDRLAIPAKPLDVLAQQLVAEVAAREWGEDELYAMVRQAYPYRNLARPEFDAVVRMLADGFATRRGRRSAYLHRDAVNRRLRARKGARLVALTCGGTIPENADYQVVLEPAGTVIGTLNEDFAIESMSGDVFQLGNSSYRVLKIEPGRVRVEDAQGAPPNIPFWLGEAPARTDELSTAVARLREAIDRRLEHATPDSIQAAVDWLAGELAVSRPAAEQIIEYLAAAKRVLGALPTRDTLVMERFFDETGGMQLVIHAPFGSRVNRAFGLALRKRFCRAFNFELQAAATEDAIVLSLGETHSFPLEEVAHYLHSATVRELLVQALLDAPLFPTRFRWNATTALAVKRFRGGKKTPAARQRLEAEDLMAVVFPDCLACAENLRGDREVPDHPLVNQAIADCLHEAMDVDGLVALLAALERGEKRLLARDLPYPSPLAQETLNARPYAFLDDVPLEERRTQAVMSRRWLDIETADGFGRLDPAAIARVREEAWPQAEDADELHDALMLLGFVTETEGARHGWTGYLDALAAARRAARLVRPGHEPLWVAAEHLPIWRALAPHAEPRPAIDAPAEYAARAWSAEGALVEIVRSRLQGLGPVTAAALARACGLAEERIEAALLTLEAEGFVLRGLFTPGTPETEWCERRLLARIHRYTIRALRAEIEPVAAADFLRFLCEWHGLATDPQPEGPQALLAVVEQLEGFEAPAAAWEADILPSRLKDYDPAWLDSACLSGRAAWARLTLPRGVPGKERAASPVRVTPVALLTRKRLNLWRKLADGQSQDPPRLTSRARLVADWLREHGASFFDDIASGTGLLDAQVEEALGELVAWGEVAADGFSGLRALIRPSERRRTFARRRTARFGIEEAGRWALVRGDLLRGEQGTGGPVHGLLVRREQVRGELPRGEQGATGSARALQPDELEQVARVLLKRYGVVFRRLLEREANWLPPWYELLRVYRRLEARGEVRGGRFVGGFSGEQYALPEAVGALRAVRRRPRSGTLVSVSAADPLNLVGVLTPGARVPALAGNRVLYRDGVPLATYVGGEARLLERLEPGAEWEARNALLRQRIPPVTRVPLLQFQ